MATLRIKRQGTEFKVVELTDGREYLVGRSAECDIQLEEVKGISRQHLKIYQVNGVWVAELMSRIGGLMVNGQSSSNIEMVEGTTFLVGPYEFQFLAASRTKTTTQRPPTITQKEPKPVQLYKPEDLTPPTPMPQQQPPQPEPEPAFEGNNESTMVGTVVLNAFLKLSLGDGRAADILKLEGNIWTAGRDETCEIVIDNHHASRKHFELSRGKDGFYLTDLNSSNGTAVNGDKVKPGEPHLLESGDVISIKSVTIRFEVRDSKFDNKLSAIPEGASTNLPALIAPEGPQPIYLPMPMHTDGPAAVKVDGRLSLKDLKDIKMWKRRWHSANTRTRIAVITASVLLLLLMFKENPAPEQIEQASSVDTVPSYDKLSKEDKNVVRDGFNLARNHFMQGRYELCSSEIKKLHQRVPFYENSKELETLCAQALELQNIQREKERQEQQKAQIDQQIRAITEDCKLKINPETTLDEVSKCLAPAVELDPQNSMITEITSMIQMREEEKRLQAQATRDRRNRVFQGEAMVKKAKDLQAQGRIREAIALYEKYINDGFYAGSEGLNNAKRDVASARNKLSKVVADQISACKQSYEAAKYKAAIAACDEALREDPSSKAAKDLRAKVVSDLRKEMKAVYEDSILEESLGNIDAAKEKWKKIIEEDLPTDEYAQKAKRQLRKYGVGI